MNVELLGSLRADLGESPTWDHVNQRLWWVDAQVGDLLSTDIANGRTERTRIRPPLGGLALAHNELVVMADADVVAVPTATATPKTSRILRRTGRGLHDCGIHPDGTIWVGTRSPDQRHPDGGMLRIDSSRTYELNLTSGYRLPNGISWTPDGHSVYVVDSLCHVVYRSRFEGHLEVEREAWVVTDEDAGLPDGVCADQEGGLWVAYWGTGRVVRYDRMGRPTQTVEVPARFATSCCFGGASMRQLFITSARYDSRPDEQTAGALFVVDVEVPGLPVPLATVTEAQAD